MWDFQDVANEFLININDLILEIGAPGGTRTPDTQVRSLVLYPTELRALGTAAQGARQERSGQVYTRPPGPDTDPGKSRPLLLIPFMLSGTSS